MAEAGPPWLSAHHSALAGGDRATPGGWGGVASVCCGVVRLCGAERARFCADAFAHAKSTRTAAGSAGWRSSCAGPSTPGSATLATARSPRYWNLARRDSSRQRPRTCGAARTVEYDTASDYNSFRQASADAAETLCHSTGRGSSACTRTCPAYIRSACTRTCATVALPNRRSQCGRGSSHRAANGQPDGHFRREPQLSPSGRTC
jgi:hypothetical protein